MQMPLGMGVLTVIQAFQTVPFTGLHAKLLLVACKINSILHVIFILFTVRVSRIISGKEIADSERESCRSHKALSPPIAWPLGDMERTQREALDVMGKAV